MPEIKPITPSISAADAPTTISESLDSKMKLAAEKEIKKKHKKTRESGELAYPVELFTHLQQQHLSVGKPLLAGTQQPAVKKSTAANLKGLLTSTPAPVEQGERHVSHQAVKLIDASALHHPAHRVVNSHSLQLISTPVPAAGQFAGTETNKQRMSATSPAKVEHRSAANVEGVPSGNSAYQGDMFRENTLMKSGAATEQQANSADKIMAQSGAAVSKNHALDAERRDDVQHPSALSLFHPAPAKEDAAAALASKTRTGHTAATPRPAVLAEMSAADNRETTIRYRFNQWGNSHYVNINRSATEALPLRVSASDNLVQERLSSSLGQSDGAPAGIREIEWDQEQQSHQRGHQSQAERDEDEA